MPAQTEIPTRDRILYASAELLRRQGYAATGLKQIAEASSATPGSIYHYYPGGKEEIAEQALLGGGQFFLALYETFAEPAPDFETCVRDFFTGAGETVAATDYLDACPIATIAGEIASTNPRLREASEAAFESWLAAMQRDAEAEGLEPAVARQLALALLALIEGAFLLCRTSRSTEAMEAATVAASRLVESTVATGRLGG